MLHKKSKRPKKAEEVTGDAIRARVKKEMAKPRMARSARIAERDIHTSRIPEKPNTTLKEASTKSLGPDVRGNR
ncbi:MAG TPA: hypothetical protein VNH65_03940 [Candidatus Acidoferrum sp.]|nr:hypothetical protein [Candidatus Acidoferrum sp.]